MFLLGGTIKEEILPTHLEYWPKNTDTEHIWYRKILIPKKWLEPPR